MDWERSRPTTDLVGRPHGLSLFRGRQNKITDSIAEEPVAFRLALPLLPSEEGPACHLFDPTWSKLVASLAKVLGNFDPDPLKNKKITKFRNRIWLRFLAPE